MTETWRGVPGFPQYEVSSLGRVRSNLFHGKPRTKILKRSLRGKCRDYWGVTLYNDGVAYSMKVSRIVAMSFLGAIPPGMQVNHKDGNKLNDCPNNLEIVTASENIRHAFNTGLNHGLSGKLNGMYGRSHSKETRQKMREAKLKRRGTN